MIIPKLYIYSYLNSLSIAVCCIIAAYGEDTESHLVTSHSNSFHSEIAIGYKKTIAYVFMPTG